ncbi:zinc finger C2HC domain-containing protein 1B-like [Hemitrygon akajei]|uniref:zinc finger C2HC domain-containing protein 1B-like n=1 Tax=Hemitrygon akajei TaxID=2704970 RepID=UPI003BF9E23B
MNSWLRKRGLTLAACKICGRSFEADSLARHEPICSKVNNKKKRVFNSYKQRAQGTELSSVRGSLVGKNFAPPVSHWREQHEDFINTIRNARLSTNAMKKGLPLPPPPPPSINPDYIECPYCNRRFNETAAERHINFCKSNVKRKVVARQTIQPPTTSQAKAPSPRLQVHMASKPMVDTSRAAPAPSSSQQTAWGPLAHSAPPARTGPSVYSPSSVRASQKAGKKYVNPCT